MDVDLRNLWKINFSIRRLNAKGPISYVIRLCSEALKDKEKINTKLLFLVESCYDKMREILNIGNWKEVSITDRQIVTLLCYHQAWLYVSLNKDLENSIIIKNVMEIIDKGLLFGAPLPSPYDSLLQKCVEVVSSFKSNVINNIDIKFTELRHSESKQINLNKIGQPLEISICPSIITFNDKYMKRKHPVVLQKCIENWPCLTLWNSSRYLIDKIGNRIVPVELGSKYTDSDWTQKLITVRDFIETYILKNSSTVGYLAQHQLFDQIPELCSDFNVPDYCCLHEDDSSDATVDINAWFGPANTVSPLHTDPKHNLLCQIVGEKLIILISPDDTPHLYCHSGNLLQNTSQVDPINPDLTIHPDFVKAQCHFHILKSGEMLYIPPKWWHYVTSLTPSFSLSFWWM